jgi:hypothetical protein
MKSPVLPSVAMFAVKGFSFGAGAALGFYLMLWSLPLWI